MWFWLAQMNYLKAYFPFNSPLLDIKVKQKSYGLVGKRDHALGRNFPNVEQASTGGLKNQCRILLPLENKGDIKSNSHVAPQDKTQD